MVFMFSCKEVPSELGKRDQSRYDQLQSSTERSGGPYHGRPEDSDLGWQRAILPLRGAAGEEINDGLPAGSLWPKGTGVRGQAERDFNHGLASQLASRLARRYSSRGQE